MHHCVSKGASIIALPSDYVVVDTETTGLDPVNDEMIELSAIKYVGGKQVAHFTTLINPGRMISPFITNLTGISNRMVANAPTVEAVLPAFLNFVGDAIIVGQNIAFDMNFLHYATVRHNLPPMTNDHINIMRIARKVYPGMPSYKLCSIAEACHVPYIGAHRSLTDCEITGACYAHMKEIVLSKMSEGEFVGLFGKRRY